MLPRLTPFLVLFSLIAVGCDSSGSSNDGSSGPSDREPLSLQQIPEVLRLDGEGDLRGWAQMEPSYYEGKTRCSALTTERVENAPKVRFGFGTDSQPQMELRHLFEEEIDLADDVFFDVVGTPTDSTITLQRQGETSEPFDIEFSAGAEQIFNPDTLEVTFPSGRDVLPGLDQTNATTITALDHESCFASPFERDR